MTTAADLLDLALRLPEKDRAELAHGLLKSLGPPDPDEYAAAETDETWAAEMERRAEEMERGEAESVDAREAVERIRAVLRSERAGDAP